MKLAATRALYAYWVSQRKGRSAPDRHDLDPAAMRGVLPHVFMLEVDAQVGSFPIRISGTRLDALFGRDLKGTSFPDLWAEDHRIELRAILSDVLDGTQPVIAGLHGAPVGYAPALFELLILPLRHHGRTHARLLCGLFPCQSSRWVGLQAVNGLHLTSWRCIDQTSDFAPEHVAAGGFRRDHLVVYEGGRSTTTASAEEWQSHVKAVVPRSRDPFISSRGS